MMRVLALLPEMTTAHLFLLSACTRLAAEVSFIEPRQRARDLKMEAQNIDKRKKKKENDNIQEFCQSFTALPSEHKIDRISLLQPRETKCRITIYVFN